MLRFRFLARDIREGEGGVEMLQVAAYYRICDKMWHDSHWAHMQTFPLFVCFFFNKNALKLP